MEFIVAILLSFLNFFTGGDQVVSPTTNPIIVTPAEVVQVIDGDTIVVWIDDQEKIIRYIGIDTPEPYRDTEPACFSLEASLKNQELVKGGTVRLESDSEDTDRYDRLLRYVYVDDMFVNAELVRCGYAKRMPIKPNIAHQEEFAKLEREARAQNLGLWGACP